MAFLSVLSTLKVLELLWISCPKRHLPSFPEPLPFPGFSQNTCINSSRTKDFLSPLTSHTECGVLKCSCTIFPPAAFPNTVTSVLSLYWCQIVGWGSSRGLQVSLHYVWEGKAVPPNIKHLLFLKFLPLPSIPKFTLAFSPLFLRSNQTKLN